MTDTDAAAGADGDGVLTGASGSAWGLVTSLAAVAAVVACVQPFSMSQLSGLASFVPAVLALVCGLDLLSAVLLARQFRDSGDRRALVLASSYVFSLAVLAGYAAAFPGVLGAVGPLGAWPSTAPWLWVVWHTGFPVLLAAGVAPWPCRWTRPVRGQVRRSVAWAGITAAAGAGAGIVAVVAATPDWVPVIIDGLTPPP